MPRRPKMTNEVIDGGNSLPPKKKGRGVKGDPRISNKELHDALTLSGGLISPVAKYFTDRGRSITEQAIRDRMERDPKLAGTVELGRERMVDRAEIGLAKGIAEGNMTAIIFALKCLGKGRGYVEKQQVEATVEASVNVEPVRHVFNYPNNGRLQDGQAAKAD